MFTYQDASGSNGPPPSLGPSIAADDLRPVSPGLGAQDQDDNPLESEEALIMDHRANLGPAQQVENKLSTLLGGAIMPVSHVRMSARLGSWSHR